MLKTKEVFEVDRQRISSTIDQTDGEVVTVRDIINTEEPRNKFRYQFIEILIYFGWPVLVVFLLNLIFPQLHFAVLLLTFIFFVLWPWIKGKIGLYIAMKKKIKDPRHAIRSSSFWSDGFMFVGSSALNLVRKYSALSKSLDIIYNLPGRFGIMPKDFDENWWKKTSRFFLLNIIIKKWTNLWFMMPIARDVRTRLEFVTQEIKRMSLDIYSKSIEQGISKKIRIVLLAGGTKQDVIMAISDLKKEKKDLDVEIVCVEPDGTFAVRRSYELMDHFGVDRNLFTDLYDRVYVEPESKKTLADCLNNKGYNFKDFDIVVCIGLGDYMYGDKIYSFLKMLDNGNKIITANITDNFVERFFLHVMLQWPKMQYLSLRTYKKILVRVFGVTRRISILRTPNKIFNIAVIE
ncbi:MAG: hypothetical protein V1865_00680 [bacterium]